MTSTELIEVSMNIGQRLLQCGAETYRVEDAIFRICKSYDATEINVYAVPTTIITSFTRNNEAPITRVARIHKRSTNLGLLDRLNTLCRDICREKLDYASIKERLHLIDVHTGYPKIMLCLATGGGAAFFTFLFGGGVIEAICSLTTCVILWYMIEYMNHIRTNKLFINIVGGFWIASTALLCYKLGIIKVYENMVIGSIMILVPGLVLTNAIRDLIAGDIVAGITKFTEALLVAAGIAVGAAVPFSFAGLLGG